jgi:hypothetical protein
VLTMTKRSLDSLLFGIGSMPDGQKQYTSSLHLRYPRILRVSQEAHHFIPALVYNQLSAFEVAVSSGVRCC